MTRALRTAFALVLLALFAGAVMVPAHTHALVTDVAAAAGALFGSAVAAFSEQLAASLAHSWDT